MEDTALADDKEFETTDQSFAAYLATKPGIMFLGAVDTGERMGKGKYGTKKAFQFLVPAGENIEQHRIDLANGADASKVPFIVAFNKLRLMRQSCQRPFNPQEQA